MTTFSECLRIKFDPSEKLTELSSKTDTTFQNLLKKTFLDRDYWQILTGFSQARYYNFALVFIAMLEGMECDLVLEIIQSEGFPVGEIITADILANPRISACFAYLPDSFFIDKLKVTPMQSSHYRVTDWKPNQHSLFMKLSYENYNIKTNWYSWCFDPKLSLDYIESLTTWKIINFNCIKEVPEILSINFLEILSPTQQLIAFNHQIDRTTRSRISSLMNSIVYAAPSDEEIEIARNQIMRVMTISTYLIIYPQNCDLYNRAKFSLNSYLNNLKTNRRKFPLKQELKQFIRNLFSSPSERDTFAQICSLLLSFLDFCKGYARGSWILNIFLLWNHFRGDSYLMLNQFLDEFITTFLSPESFTTVSEICLFLRLVNFWISGPLDDYFTIERIFSKFFLIKISLAREVLKECPAEIPKSKQKNSSAFPLNFRLEQVFKQSRFIENFSAHPVAVCMKKPPERICFSVFNLINRGSETYETPILPLNIKLSIRNGSLELNLTRLLQVFFQNLIFTSHWFDHFHRPKNRLILTPSLTFPPQLMEFIGFMLGKAVILNLKVPFIIDKRYFELRDAFDRTGEPPRNIVAIMREIYPNMWDFTTSLQVHRIIESLDFSAARILELLTQPGYILGPISSREPELTVNDPYNMYRIILMGSERLRIGLNQALPSAYLLKPQELYNLISK